MDNPALEQEAFELINKAADIIHRAVGSKKSTASGIRHYKKALKHLYAARMEVFRA